MRIELYSIFKYIQGRNSLQNLFIFVYCYGQQFLFQGCDPYLFHFTDIMIKNRWYLFIKILNTNILCYTKQLPKKTPITYNKDIKHQKKAIKKMQSNTGVIVRWTQNFIERSLNMWLELGNGYCEDQIKYIEQSESIMRKILTMSSCLLNDDKVVEICKKKWNNLEKLDLSYNQISEVGVKDIARCEWPSLQALFLCHNNIGNDGMNLILQNLTSKLRNFSIKNAKFNHEGLKSIPSEHLGHLKSLELSDNKIGSKGIKLLIKSSIPNLESIGLRNCELNNEGMAHLSKNMWTHIKRIGLTQNEAVFSGFIQLYKSNWVKLQRIQVGDLNKYYWIQYLSMIPMETRKCAFYFSGESHSQFWREMRSFLDERNQL